MASPKTLRALAFMLVTTSVALGTGYRPPYIPARELLRAIDELEESDAAAIQNLEAQALSPRGGVPAAASQDSLVDWDPYASPDSIRSWMMFNLKDETWRRLRDNVDQRGRPLL